MVEARNMYSQTYANTSQAELLVVSHDVLCFQYVENFRDIITWFTCLPQEVSRHCWTQFQVKVLLCCKIVTCIYIVFQKKTLSPDLVIYLVWNSFSRKFMLVSWTRWQKDELLSYHQSFTFWVWGQSVSNGHHSMDVLFSSQSTPAFVSLKTSCDLTVRTIAIFQKQCKVFLWDCCYHVCSLLVCNFFSFMMTVIQELHLLLLRFCGILISFLHQWQLLFARRRLQIANRLTKLIHLWISMLHLASFDCYWGPGDKHGEEGIVDSLRDLLINSEDKDDESDSADTSHSTE